MPVEVIDQTLSAGYPCERVNLTILNHRPHYSGLRELDYNASILSIRFWGSKYNLNYAHAFVTKSNKETRRQKSDQGDEIRNV